MESILPYCSSIIGNEYSIYTAMLVAGLVGGFAHCAGMCGPFVIMQASSNMGNDSSGNFTEFSRLKNTALLPYHFGRIITYTLLASIAAYLSSHILSFDSMRWFSALLLGFSGVILLSYALLRGGGNFLGFNITIPKFLENRAKPFFMNPKGFNGLALGAILGFIPCGMVIAAIFAVSAYGSVAIAATAMILFGLGTIPGLFTVSYGSNFLLSRGKFNVKNFQRFAIFFSGVILLTTAYGILF